MSHGLVAWCVGSVAACAAAGLGALVVKTIPHPAATTTVAIRIAPDFNDPTREMAPVDPPLALGAIEPEEAVPAGFASSASLFADLPRGLSLRPAFMDVVAEYRPEEAAAPPQSDVREILTEAARSRDLARALVRPPPRPVLANRQAGEPDRQAEESGAEPSAKGPSSVFGFLPGSLFGGSDAAAASSGHPGRTLQSGVASWYGPGFNGRKTASGERFNQNDLTAAHRSLPFGTRVKVVDPATGRSVIVRINDRGPYAHGRVIDLSRASAEALGIQGLARVQLVSAE